MFDLWNNRATLAALYLHAMGRAFLRLKDPRRRASGKHQDAFYKKAWREAAESLGGTCTPLGDAFSEITVAGNTTRVFENVSGIDDPITLRILHDKLLTAEILSAEGIATPRNAAFSLKKMKPAIAFLESGDRDCVVKPARGTGGGRGITTGVRRRSHLALAAAAAACYCDELLIEEQLEGDNYRLLYLDGELLDAFVRRPPSVVGDGRSTLRQLVSDANEDRLKHGSGKSQVLIAIDLDMRRTLARQGLSLRSIPPAGQHVTLKTVINENTGADNSTATELLCDSIVKDGQKAVRALRARFVGIDVITRDPSVPLVESGGAIIEANGTPNLYFHYHKKDSCFAAAIPLLRRILVESEVSAPLRP
jgi:cyanophycin synthetase